MKCQTNRHVYRRNWCQQLDWDSPQSETNVSTLPTQRLELLCDQHKSIVALVHFSVHTCDCWRAWNLARNDIYTNQLNSNSLANKCHQLDIRQCPGERENKNKHWFVCQSKRNLTASIFTSHNFVVALKRKPSGQMHIGPDGRILHVALSGHSILVALHLSLSSLPSEQSLLPLHTWSNEMHVSLLAHKNLWFSSWQLLTEKRTSQ